MPLDTDARTAWHTLGPADVASAQEVDAGAGLQDAEAADRLERIGANELDESGGRTIWHILWEQVSSVLILILVFAGGLAAALGKTVDAVAILAIVVLFVVLGVVQEYRAQRAIAALKQMSAPAVRLLRGGRTLDVSSREVVPGDVVLLEAGNVVPADLRIVESQALRVQEAALTGESEPVEKAADALDDPELTVGDRTNMAFKGTAVTYGRGKGIVVETGMRTELGRIADMLGKVRHEPTPLQRRLDSLGKVLAIAAVVIAAIVAVAGWMRGDDVTLVLLTGVSLAVAIVPEGLPAVLTLTLALGSKRMLKRNALIRKLPAVETLGSVTVICSDKTGTLTQNRMTATAVHTLGGRFALHPADADALSDRPDVAVLLAAASLCNDAFFRGGECGGHEAVGDPTETALIVVADRFGLSKRQLEAQHPRTAEIAFDSARKRMSTLHRPGADAALPAAIADAPVVAFTKGAVDSLLPRCTQAIENGQLVPLDEEHREGILAANEGFGSEGMRVLAVAARPLAEEPATLEPEAVEAELVFLGLVAMIDPPREEAADAVATCRRAGIRPVMITGDHPLTARRIAADLGICAHDARVVTGVEVERMSPADLGGIVGEVAVYARVSPEHKLKIIEALQARGEVVAMTGDGVNDAPALRRADIGVAMGSGTDVAKEAGDMVLLDDNFATIVAAVEEGRVVYDNIRRFVQFSVAGNWGKVLTVAVPPFLGLPLLLYPVQILFSNLLTDGLLGLGMGVEKGERDAMQRPPIDPREPVFNRAMSIHVAWLGTLIGLVTIGVGAWAYGGVTADGTFTPGEAAYVSTLVFTTLALLQLGRVQAIRSFRDPVWKRSPLANPALVALVAIAFTLQMIAVYLPAAQPFFHTVGLGAQGLAIGAAAGVLVLLAAEIEKAIWRRRGAAADG